MCNIVLVSGVQHNDTIFAYPENGLHSESG